MTTCSSGRLTVPVVDGTDMVRSGYTYDVYGEPTLTGLGERVQLRWPADRYEHTAAVPARAVVRPGQRGVGGHGLIPRGNITSVRRMLHLTAAWIVLTQALLLAQGTALLTFSTWLNWEQTVGPVATGEYSPELTPGIVVWWFGTAGLMGVWWLAAVGLLRFRCDPPTGWLLAAVVVVGTVNLAATILVFGAAAQAASIPAAGAAVTVAIPLIGVAAAAVYDATLFLGAPTNDTRTPIRDSHQ